MCPPKLDEATVHVYSMIDQLIEGHQWAKNHLNAIPKSSWSVDPFGHGSTMPYLLKAAGIKSMVIQVSTTYSLFYFPFFNVYKISTANSLRMEKVAR